MTKKITSWNLGQKLAFRFCFLFLGITSLLCWDFNIIFALLSFSVNYDPTIEYKPFAGVFHWLDQHLFHTGYDPKLHPSFPQDNHFGAVYYLAIFLLAIIGAIVWSLLDRKRPSYSRLLHWFNLYLRYTLGLTLIGYGSIN